MPQIKINGVEHSIDADPQMPLLWAIRDILGLTGTKFGCGVGACGVHNPDGRSGRALLSDDCGRCARARDRHDRGPQRRWRSSGAARLGSKQCSACGYCQPGEIMQAAALLQQTPHPNDQQIVDAMSGNICRCGTYQRIRQAIRSAAEAV